MATRRVPAVLLASIPFCRASVSVELIADAPVCADSSFWRLLVCFRGLLNAVEEVGRHWRQIFWSCREFVTVQLESLLSTEV